MSESTMCHYYHFQNGLSILRDINDHMCFTKYSAHFMNASGYFHCISFVRENLYHDPEILMSPFWQASLEIFKSA